MNVRNGLSTYFPERSPTWIELYVGIVAGGSVGHYVLTDSITSWPAVAIGFLAFGLALGPGANSAFGQQIGQWFRSIGGVGRAFVIVLFAITVVAAFQFEAAPAAFIRDTLTGGVLAIVLYTFAYVVWAGEVSGWIPDPKTSD